MVKYFKGIEEKVKSDLVDKKEALLQKLACIEIHYNSRFKKKEPQIRKELREIYIKLYGCFEKTRFNKDYEKVYRTLD
jgi:hypothetical protein